MDVQENEKEEEIEERMKVCVSFLPQVQSIRKVK